MSWGPGGRDASGTWDTRSRRGRCLTASILGSEPPIPLGQTTAAQRDVWEIAGRSERSQAGFTFPGEVLEPDLSVTDWPQDWPRENAGATDPGLGNSPPPLLSLAVSAHTAGGVLCWATNGRALRGKKENPHPQRENQEEERKRKEWEKRERKKERKEREKGKEKKKETGREKEQGSIHRVSVAECTNTHRKHSDKIMRIFLIYYVSRDLPLCLSYYHCSC